MAAHSAYVRKETAISMAINAVISAAFTWAVFGGQHNAPMWALGGVVADLLPQTFLVSLMSELVPTLLTRKRRRVGAIAYEGQPSRIPGNALVRAFGIALVATIVLVGIAAASIAASGIDWISVAVLFPMKIAYGAVVAAIVTPLALRVELGRT